MTVYRFRATGSGDGHIVSSAGTWADAQDGSGTLTVTTAGATIATGTNTTEVTEGFSAWDTSSVGDSETCMFAAVKVTPPSNWGGGSGPDFKVARYDWGGTLEAADWRTTVQLQALDLIARGGGGRDALANTGTVVAKAKGGSGSALDSAINKTGTTQFVTWVAEAESGSSPGLRTTSWSGAEASNAWDLAELVLFTDGGSAPYVTDLSTPAEDSGASLEVVVPDIPDGHMALLYAYGRDAVALDFSTPANWTLVQSATTDGTNGRLSIFKRINSTGSTISSATVSVPYAGSEALLGGAVVVGRADDVGAIVTKTDNNGTSHTIPSVTTTASNSLVFAFVGGNDDPPFEYQNTDRFPLFQGSDQSTTSGLDAAAAVLVSEHASAGATGTDTITSAGSYRSVVIAVEVTKAVVPAADTPGEPFEAITPIIEFAFGDSPLAASPTWVDVSEYCTGFSVRRGRSSLLDDFDAGTAVIRLENVDGRFDPNNTSGAYYPDVTMRVPVRLSIDYDGTDYIVFRGMVEAWPIQYGAGGFDSWCDVPLVDLTKLLAGYQLDAFALSSSDSVGDRIEAVLDEVGWPGGLRDIDAGLAARPDVTFTGSAIDLIRDEARADSGFFFIAADGSATYRTRTAYEGGNLVNGTFGQAVGELAYERLAVSFDDDRLFNVAVVSQATGYDEVDTTLDSVVTVTDTTSVSNFGPTRFEIQSAWSNEPEALSAAQWAVARFKDQRVRVRGMTLFPQFDEANMYPQVLGRDLRDGLVVKFQPPGGGTPLNQEVAVESIEHDVTATSWVTRWSLEPLASIETGDFFTLDTSVLDGSDVLA